MPEPMTPPRPLQTGRHQTVIAPPALAALPLHVVQPADPGVRRMRPLEVAPAGVIESPHFFLHQLTKTAVERTTGTDHLMDLADLAFAGITEFSRQWMLVHRLGHNSPGSGRHRRRLGVRGSTWHSGQWDVTIDEGSMGGDFGGRTWNVQVSDSGRGDEADVSNYV